jgi:hypothetical protein
MIADLLVSTTATARSATATRGTRSAAPALRFGLGTVAG